MPPFGPPDVEKLKRKRDVPGLIKALGYQKEDDREAAAEALVQIGAPAVKPLIDILNDNDRSVRWYAVRALGQIGDPAAVEPLIAASTDPLVSVRSVAVGALVQIGAPAVKALIAALPSWAAAEALGRIGDTRAVEPLIAVLPNWTAINALGKIGDVRAVAAPPRRPRGRRCHGS
jgi:HEAT repeat protein